MQSDASSSPPSLVSALHRHALESVLGFFSFRELPELMHVCRAFHSAVGSMAPLHASIRFNPKDNISRICNSPLIMHVGALSSSIRLNASALGLLASKAVNLRSLRLELFSAPSDQAWVLPPKLTHLSVAIWQGTAAVINGVLSAAASLSSLAELDVEIPSLQGLCLDPLMRLESLQSLRIAFRSNPAGGMTWTMSREHLDVIRGLSRSLTSLDTAYFGLSLDSFRELFGAGHSFRLKNLGRSLLWLTLTDEVGGLITSLPLESLMLYPTTTVAFLPRLAPTLHELQLDLERCTLEPDAIVAVVSQLRLISLTLLYSKLSAVHLTTLVCNLPQLRHLSLSDMGELQSLAFLSVQGAPKLYSLSLSDCHLLSPAELQHVRRAQPQLTDLTLTCSFNALLDAFSLSLLQPPSELFPLLRSFYYEAPTIRAQNDDE